MLIQHECCYNNHFKWHERTNPQGILVELDKYAVIKIIFIDN